MSATEIVLVLLVLAEVVYICYQHIHYNRIINHLINQQPMATFTDLQTADANLTAAASTLTTAISNYVAAHSSDITSAQADTIVADINAATASLTAAAATLTT